MQGAAEGAGEAAGQAASQAGSAAEQATDEAATADQQSAQGAAPATGGAAATSDPSAGTAEAPAEATVQTTDRAGDTEPAADAQTVETTTVPVTEQPADAGTATVDATQADVPPEPVKGTITLQDADSILASDLIGATVYNAEGDDVGEIDDAIVGLDGTIQGVVIGVGGFLGLGEKSVAVEMQQISVQEDEDGDPQLIIDASRESLEAAPEFTTADEQAREAQASTVPQPAGTAPGTPAAEPGAVGAGAPTEGGTTAPAQ